MSKRKYKRGKPITSLADYESSKSIWFEVGDVHMRMVHRAALDSLQIHTFYSFLKRGLYEADRVEAEGGDAE